MYHPASENADEEFIEIYNNGTNTVDLTGWRFTDGISFVFPNTLIAPGEYLVVAANINAFTNLYPNVTSPAGNWDGILSNSGEKVELTDAAGNVVDSVDYADEGDWAVRERGPYHFGHRGWEWYSAADGRISSLELITAGLPNEYGQNWKAGTATNGTPGAVNSIVKTNLPPMILEARHFPVVPKSTQPITFTVHVVDEAVDEINLNLRYRIDGKPDFNSIQLHDDGAHGDAAANDAIFGVELPPFAHGTILEFYYQATDNKGNTRSWPAPALIDGAPSQSANLLLQVDDQPFTGQSPTYRLIMTQAEMAEFDQIVSSWSLSHSEMNGTFISHDGTGPEVRYLVGIRNRGNASRGKRPNNFRVNFRSDAKWRGIEALNINSQYPHVQYAGSVLYRLSGLPTQTARPVLIRANNVDPTERFSGKFSFYACNEVLDSDFADAHFPNDPSGNIYRGIRLHNMGANLAYLGDDPEPYKQNYFKRTNKSEDDWSDLFELTRVLDTTPESNYVQEVRRVVDVTEWMRYFAIETIVDNKETNLGNGNNGTGQGDDYFLYSGVLDKKFKVLPYDLDTIMGEGDSSGDVDDGLFRAAANPIIERFLKHPEFAPVYYHELHRILNSTFAPENFDPTIEEILKNLVFKSRITRIKEFMHARRDFILSQIPTNINITTSFPRHHGYSTTTAETVSLTGTADIVHTRSVKVNGADASWTAWKGEWNIANIPLHPGANTITISALDESGTAFETLTTSIVRDTPSNTPAPELINTNTTWTPETGPYHVQNTLTVADNTSLTIAPGTTVFFDPGTGMRVFGNLHAAGTPNNRIRFTISPAVTNNTTNAWAGITFSDSSETNVFAFADIDYAGSSGESISTDNSTLVIDNCTWNGTTQTIIETHDSSLYVKNSVFPSIIANELIHGARIPQNGFFVLENNTFGSTTRLNDIIDFSDARLPNPIPEFYDNIFTGASDDVLDLDGCDAFIEGNIFMNVHQDLSNPIGDTASAISFGEYGGYSPRVVAVRNIFYNVDHIALAKEDSFISLINNTALNCDISGVNFNEPLRQLQPGKGALLDGNIIWNTATNFENVIYQDHTAELTVKNSILSGADFPEGNTNNLQTAPAFVATNGITAGNIKDALRLRAGSPAIGAGPNGLDMGALVPSGASVSGVPTSISTNSSITLTVGGPGITHYKYKLNNAAYSEEIPVDTPIRLTNLAGGDYVVRVLGKNYAGTWQTHPTTSESWTLGPAQPDVRLNEIIAAKQSLYNNSGEMRDTIELYNAGAAAADLGGLGVTDDPALHTPFVFPEDTIIEPGAYLVLYADSNTNMPGIHLGFNLDHEGEVVCLLDLTAPETRIVDSVKFGLQLPGLSISRSDTGSWQLAKPTIGRKNIPVPTGDITDVKINEWLANANLAAGSDFLELFNDSHLPVDIGRAFLSDLPIGFPNKHQLPPLTFIAPKGYALFFADGKPAQGGNHLNFKLASEQGEIGLFDQYLNKIDHIIYNSQTTDVSEGRTPNGADSFTHFRQPTPGAGNPGISPQLDVQTFDLMSMTNSWKYEATGRLNVPNWMTADYDDSSWPEGNALFYKEGDGLPGPKNTPLELGPITYYFRSHFEAPTKVSNAAMLHVYSIIDDGAVIYLNGEELLRIGMDAGEVTPDTRASRTVYNADFEGPFTAPATNIVAGENLIAVEVHQTSSGSSDIVFGLSLTASITITNQDASMVRLNEVFAAQSPLAAAPSKNRDWIELFNPSTSPADLTGFSLSDDPANPRQWLFPSNTVIMPNDYLVVTCDPDTAPSTENTGFGIDASGEIISLYSAQQEAPLTDSIEFGTQVPGYTISFFNESLSWKLSKPTPNATNQSVALGNPYNVRINEWMAAPATGDDWFELFNPETHPVDISGFHLSDDLTDRKETTLRNLSFIGADPNAFLLMKADDETTKGGDHTSFKLSADGEAIGFFDKDGFTIDAVEFGPQSTGVSEGRYPDGANNILAFPGTSTPDLANQAPSWDYDGDTIPDTWENSHGLDPFNINDAHEDPDNDGMSNLSEFLAGTNPQDAASLLSLSIQSNGPHALTLEFNGVTGKEYQIQYSDSIAGSNNNWRPLSTIKATNNSSISFDTITSTNNAGFYRVNIINTR